MLKAIAGADSLVKLGYSLMSNRSDTPSENKRSTSDGLRANEIVIADPARKPSKPSPNLIVLATLPKSRHRTLPIPATLPSCVEPSIQATLATAPRVPRDASCSTFSASSGLGFRAPGSQLESLWVRDTASLWAVAPCPRTSIRAINTPPSSIRTNVASPDDISPSHGRTYSPTSNLSSIRLRPFPDCHNCAMSGAVFDFQKIHYPSGTR